MPILSSAVAGAALSGAAVAAMLCVGAGLSASPALAASCSMTVQGVPVIDGQDCSAAGRPGDVRIAVGGGTGGAGGSGGADGTIRVRRSIMTGRFVVRRPGDGRPRRVTVNYGPVVASTDSDDKTCYFNQKATLCLDP